MAVNVFASNTGIASFECANAFSEGSLWSCGIVFSGEFDKAAVFLDDYNIITLYYNASDEVLSVKDDSVSKVLVDSFSISGRRLTLVLYPLASGEHEFESMLFLNAELFGEAKRTILFIDNNSLFSSLSKVSGLEGRVESSESELERLKEGSESFDSNLSALASSIDSVKEDLSLAGESAVALNGRLSASEETLGGEIDSLKSELGEIRKKQVAFEEDNKKNPLNSAFVVIGNSFLPIILIVAFIILFFAISFLRKKFGGAREFTYEEGFPKKKKEDE